MLADLLARACRPSAAAPRTPTCHPSPNRDARDRRTRRCTGSASALSAHWRAWKLPAWSTKIASPGATSRSTRKPSGSSATDSDATRYSVPPIGLVDADDQRPDAERIAEREHAVAGDHRHDGVRAAAAAMARRRPRGRSHRGRAGDAAPRARARAPARSAAPRESELVLTCRKSSSNSSRFSASLFVRLPLCAERQPERRIDVERLRFELGERRARRRIAAMRRCPSLPCSSRMLRVRNTSRT